MVLLGCNRCFGTCGAWFGSDHGCAAKASDIVLRKHIREIVVGGGICRPEWGSRVAICYSYLYRNVGPNGPEAISNSRASILSSSKPHCDSVFNEALTMLRPKRDSVPLETTTNPSLLYAAQVAKCNGGICRPEWGSRVSICYSYLYRDVGPNGPEAISNSRASILSSSKPHCDSVFNEALTMLRPKRDSVPPKTTDRPAACLRKALKSRPSSAGRTKTGALDFNSVTRGVGGREQDRRFEEF